MIEQVIKYSDGTETSIKYNPLGEKVEQSESEVVKEVLEEMDIPSKKQMNPGMEEMEEVVEEKVEE